MIRFKIGHWEVGQKIRRTYDFHGGVNKLFVRGEQTVCSPLITDPDVPIFYFISSLIELKIILSAGEQSKGSKTVFRFKIGHWEVGQKIGRTHERDRHTYKLRSLLYRFNIFYQCLVNKFKRQKKIKFDTS